MTDFNRDRWGRPLIIPEDGGKPVAYTRFSSHGQCLEDRFGLEKWKIRTAGKGLAVRADLYAQVAACHADDTRRLDQLMEAALEAGGSSIGAGLGTALHEFTQNLDLGIITLDDIPEPWRADIAAYQNTLTEHGLSIDKQLIEVALVNDELCLAGTADRFYERIDGTLVCADIKTGKAIGDNPLAYIVQLAAYANSVQYDIETGKRTNINSVDLNWGILVHLPAGQARCDIYQVNLIEGLELAKLASQVRTKQKYKGLVSRIEPTDGTSVAPVAEPGSLSPDDPGSAAIREWLIRRVDIIRENEPAFAQLRQFWPATIPTFKQADNHTADQLHDISTLLDLIESNHQIPFGASKPITKSQPVETKSIVKRVNPDDSIDADPTNIAELRNQLGALNNEQKTWVQTQTKRANSAGHPISLKQRPSLRRYHIAQFLIAAAEFSNDDILTAVLQQFTDRPLDSGKAFGYVLGTMNTETAIRAAALMFAINAGTIVLSFDDDGQPTLTGDLAAYQSNPT